MTAMKHVFVVQHLHTLPDGEDDVKLIGVYSTAEEARAAVTRLAAQPGLRDHRNVVDVEHDEDHQGFHVDRYELDRRHWTEGFVTV